MDPLILAMVIEIVTVVRRKNLKSGLTKVAKESLAKSIGGIKVEAEFATE